MEEEGKGVTGGCTMAEGGGVTGNWATAEGGGVTGNWATAEGGGVTGNWATAEGRDVTGDWTMAEGRGVRGNGATAEGRDVMGDSTMAEGKGVTGNRIIAEGKGVGVVKGTYVEGEGVFALLVISVGASEVRGQTHHSVIVWSTPIHPSSVLFRAPTLEHIRNDKHSSSLLQWPSHLLQGCAIEQSFTFRFNGIGLDIESNSRTVGSISGELVGSIEVSADEPPEGGKDASHTGDIDGVAFEDVLVGVIEGITDGAIVEGSFVACDVGGGDGAKDGR